MYLNRRINKNIKMYVSEAQPRPKISNVQSGYHPVYSHVILAPIQVAKYLEVTTVAPI